MSLVKEKPIEKVEEKSKPVMPARVYEYSPDVDIYSDNKTIYIEANVPGVDETHLDLSLEKNILTIKGEADTAAPENFQLKYAEYYPGNFKRSFHLGEDIDHDAIEAVVKNGVLRLKLPVKDALSRRISVKAE
jgi:HSP20 family protein